jgi:hypothetical protein
MDHDQQLHQGVIGRRAGWLHNEDVASANVLHQLNIDLTVTEPADVRAPERRLQIASDF